MAQRADPISDIDLCAYVDGQLEVARRLEVEDHLARHPEAAAAVMSDLRDRNAINLLLGGPTPVPPEATTLARRLDLRLFQTPLRRLLPRFSIAALALVCLLLAQDEIGELSAPANAAELPVFADEALDTHSAAILRQALPTETKDLSLDTKAIRQAARIVVPQLSRDWRILDARVVPSDKGPGIQISFDRGEGLPVTFFAVRMPDDVSFAPITSQRGNEAVSYWRNGIYGYALAGDLHPSDLERLARDLADNPPG